MVIKSPTDAVPLYARVMAAGVELDANGIGFPQPERRPRWSRDQGIRQTGDAGERLGVNDLPKMEDAGGEGKMGRI